MKKIFSFFLCLFFLYIAHAQNVGIGTTSPNAKLHVNGTLRITNGTQGAGKVLTSDATGLATWQVASTPSTTYYKSVSVCCQSWMTKNLDVATYRNGDPIPKVTDPAAWLALTTGAYCYYNNDSATYAATYGKLYNWYAVNDPRGLAPEGWHVPTDFEWTTLGNCLGGNNVAGGFMKETGTTHWIAPNNGATNSTGFNNVPGGFRSTDGSYLSNGSYAFLWSTTPYDTGYVYCRATDNYGTYLSVSIYESGIGMSVRCIKD
jgi:uncharacterized protein (TIGR02145 family)